MKNNFIFLVILFSILSNCGYQPIYSTKNLNFTIGNIEKENTSLNNKFEKTITALKNKKIDKKIDIKIKSDKKITIKSKDSKGNALVFELKINLKFSSLNLDNKTERLLSQKIMFMIFIPAIGSRRPLIIF